MSSPYSAETQRILDDMLATLSGKDEIDAEFLAQLRKMARSGSLHSRARIQETVAGLEARANELHD